MIHSKFVKKVFSKKIRDLSLNRAIHLKNPDKDFTRDRKLDFETMVHSIVTMGTSPIKDELLTLFDYDANTPTTSTSAFVQRRQLIKPSAFEALLHDFNQAFFTQRLSPSCL